MSIQISEINIKASTSGAKATADDLNKIYVEAGKLERRVETLTEKLAKLSNGFSAGTASARAYADAIALQQRALVGSQAGISQLAIAMQTLATNIATMSVSMSNSTTIVNNNRTAIQNHNAAMADAQAGARGLAGSLGMLWTTYGNTAPLAAGLAIGAGMKQIVSMGMEVENILEAMRLKGGETIETANQLRQSIADIGQGIYGPVEVTKAFETLILAGLKAKEATEAVGAALNLATAGGSTIENAAQSLVTIGTAIGATAAQFDYVADGITKAANISLASVDSIAEAMKRASVVNKLYGATFEDVLTQTAALAQLGIKNTAAGTAITNFYANAMGGSKKAKNALDELGFSFTDNTGKAKGLVEAFEGFDAALSKFDQMSQKNFIMDIFGERALRDVEALRSMVNMAADDTSKYNNKLEETRARIEGAAGESALIAAQQALTTENQFKAMSNTLKTSFVGAFSAIEPMLYSIADQLTKVFASEGFKNGIANMAYALTSLAKAFVDNLDVIRAVGEALLVVGTINAGGAIFRAMIPAVQGVAVAFGAVATAANGAAVATGLFGTAIKLIPGIGMALGAIAAVWALIELNTKKAVTATEDMNRIKSGGFLENLEKEAVRIEKINEQLAKGVDLTKAQTLATADLARQEGRKGYADAEGAAQKDLDAAQKAFNAQKIQNFSFNTTGSKEAIALVKAQGELNKAKADTVAFDKQAENYANRIVAATRQQQEQLRINQTTADTIEAGQAGTATYASGKKDKSGGVNAIQAEIDANKRWIAGHEARIELINKISDDEEKLQGNVFLSETKSFLSSEAATKAFSKMSAAQSEKVKEELLATAVEKDRLKYEEDRVKTLNEFTSKLNKAEAGLAAYNEEDGKRSNPIGQYEKEAVAIAKLTGLGSKETEMIRARSRALDDETRIQDNRKKGVQYAASSEVRAGTSKDEYENLSKYGIAVKQTASQLAELEIAKLQLNETTDKSIINDIREAASKETLWNAMKEIAKITNELNEVELERAAYATEGVIGSETAKVTALQNANQKKLDLYAADARAQISIQQAAGLITAAEASSRLGAIDAAMTKLKSNFAQSFKVAEFKDMATIFSDIGETVGKMGAGFDKASKALSGFAGAFKSLSQAQEKERVGDKTAAADKIGAYGDMAAAAGEFFEKESTGYKVMQAVSTAYHAVQLAMNLKSMISGVAAGAAQMFAQSGWGGFAGVAAMGAVMAGLGFAISGGGGSGGQAAADVQKTQGSGTVFGDATKQSESISNSIKKLQDNSNAMLPLTNAMLSSLRNIESAMVGLGNLILRSSGVSDGSSFGVATGQLNIGSPTDLVSKIGTEMTKGLFGPIVGGAIAKVLNNVWGKTTQNIVDAGIAFKGTVAQLQSGQGYSQYASVDTTKSSFFGLKKKTSNSVVSAGLGDELSNQFAMIFTSLEDTLKVAAQGFGLTTSSVSSAIDNMVLDSKVSLKDLKGQDLTDAINNVISAAMDDISKAAIPGLEKFQQVGEGYAETVIRLASNYERLNVSLSAIGLLFNSFGLSSLTLREDFIKLAGGIDEFESKVKGYYDAIYTDAQKQELAQKQVSGAMSALGYASVTTKAQFKALVDSLDLTNAAQQALFINLTALAPAFGAVADAAQEAKDSALDSAKTALRTAYDAQSSTLQTAIDRLKAFQTTLTTFINSLKTGSLSTLTPMQKLAETKSIYEDMLKAAKGGDVTAQNGITAAAQAYLTASQVVNASSDAYTQATLQVQADLNNLAAIAGSQQTSAQMELEALNKQVQGLIDLNTTTLSVKEAIDNLGIAMVASGLISKEEFAAQHGSHASGKEYIPFDNYNAVLHEGEAVIDAPAMAVLKRYFGATGNNNSSGDTKALETKMADIETAVKQMGAMVTGAVIQTGNVSANKIGGAVCDAADKQIYANKSAVTVGGR